MLRVFSKPTGPLGFGCGLLALAGNRRSAVRLLEAVYDNGIVYFDIARLYAEGLAEGMIRDAFARRRDRVILVSKAGILPTNRPLLRRAADKAIHVSRRFSWGRTLLQEPVAAGPTFGVFDIPRLRTSVETSLRELGTDYLDALLLHECTAGDADRPEIRAFADDLVRQGKIRAYGVAPRVEDAAEIDRQGIDFGTIMQVAGRALLEQPPIISTRPERLVVTHSVFSDGFATLTGHLQKNPAARSLVQKTFDIDPSNNADLADLLLRHALYLNRTGVVLFSTTRPERIAQNAKAADKLLSHDEAQKLTALLCSTRSIGT